MFNMLGALFFVACFSTAIATVPISPETVKELNVLQYMGKWYEVFSSFYPRATFERDGYCTTATYTPLTIDGDEVSFVALNSENVGGPTGRNKQIQGLATTSLLGKIAGTGKFYVFFKNAPKIGQYWVVALGPVVTKSDGSLQYDWAVVSTPFLAQLFILARDVAFFKANYEASVLSLVKDLGFNTTLNKPIRRYHSSDCQYTWKVEEEAEVGGEEGGASFPFSQDNDLGEYLWT